MGAFNADPKYPVRVTRAVIVVAYNDGFGAHVLDMGRPQLDRYWAEWNRRLDIYRSIVEFRKGQRKIGQ